MDVGEGEPRTIVSGLVKYVKKEDLQVGLHRISSMSRVSGRKRLLGSKLLLPGTPSDSTWRSGLQKVKANGYCYGERVAPIYLRTQSRFGLQDKLRC